MQPNIQLLIELQNIDTATDAIKNKKGTLPKEINHLAAQLQDLQNQVTNYENQIQEQKKHITQNKEKSKQATESIAKYKQEHLNTVHNQEEYDKITEEIALQELNIKLAKKKIKATQATLSIQTEEIERLQKLIQENQAHTQHKQASLSQINAQTQQAENKLQNQRQKTLKKIQDPTLLHQYENLRKSHNLVVTQVQNQACNGCYIIVPTQRQIKIREGKKIITCENCGRMLVKAEKTEEK